MRSKQSTYNVIAAIMLQIITLIIGIILPRVILISYGSEVNGLISSIKQFVSYLTLVEAGLAGASIYSLYKPLAEKDYDNINRVLSSTKHFYNKSGLIFTCLSLFLALSFPFIINIESINEPKIFTLVLILGFNGSMEFFSMGKYRALLTADQKGYIVSLIQGIGQIINCIIIVIMSLNKFDIVYVQLFATISYLIRSLLFSKYVKKTYKYVNFNLNSTENKYKLPQRWDVLFHQIGAMVIFNSPIAIITIFCTLVDVSIYTIYNMIFAGIFGILSIFGNSLVASIGDVISRNDRYRLKAVYMEYEYIFYMVLNFIYATTIVLIIPFIKLYTSDINDANYIINELIILFIINGIITALKLPQITIINAAGYFKETRYRALVEVIINLSLSLILVQVMGVYGVLLGGIIAAIYRTIDCVVYVSKYIINISIKYTINRIFRILFITCLIIFPFINYLNIELENMFQWIIYGIIVSIWSGLVVFIVNFILEKKLMKNVYSRLKIILKRN